MHNYSVLNVENVITRSDSLHIVAHNLPSGNCKKTVRPFHLCQELSTTYVNHPKSRCQPRTNNCKSTVLSITLSNQDFNVLLNVKALIYLSWILQATGLCSSDDLPLAEGQLINPIKDGTPVQCFHGFLPSTWAFMVHNEPVEQHHSKLNRKLSSFSDRSLLVPYYD